MKSHFFDIDFPLTQARAPISRFGTLSAVQIYVHEEAGLLFPSLVFATFATHSSSLFQDNSEFQCLLTVLIIVFLASLFESLQYGRPTFDFRASAAIESFICVRARLASKPTITFRPSTPTSMDP